MKSRAGLVEMTICNQNSLKDDETKSIMSSKSDQKEFPCNRTSCPIPFPHYHIKRTHSELQLCDEMAAAELRDQIMLCRILKGKGSHGSVSWNGTTKASHTTSPRKPNPSRSTPKETITNILDDECTGDDKANHEECMFHLEL